MAKDKSCRSEKILNLTLEIIYLLTGENFTAIKTESGRLSITQGATAEPPPQSLKQNKKNKKILQLTNKIIELLTREEQEYLEAHKDLYKEVMMEDQPRPSPGGSSERNPSELLLRPQYSKDRPEEKRSVPQDHKVESLSDFQIVVIEDIKKECEELHVVIKEEVPTDISTDGYNSRQSMESHVIASPGCDIDDDDDHLTTEAPRGNHMSVNVRGGFHSASLSSDRSNHEKGFLDMSEFNKVCAGNNNAFPHSEYIKRFNPNPGVPGLQGTRVTKKPINCTACDKSFTHNSYLIKHMRTHTGEKPFPCGDCGKCFTDNSGLTKHQRIHTGEKPFQCPECGRCFARKYHLVSHQIIHTGEKPHLCTECGKCFAQRPGLIIHRRTHRKVTQCS